VALLLGGCLDLPEKLPRQNKGDFGHDARDDRDATTDDAADDAAVGPDAERDLDSGTADVPSEDAGDGGGGDLVRWKTVSAGGGHACAITVEGALYCWGRNDHGQVTGDGADGEPQRSPVRVGPNLEPWRHVDVGETHTCALAEVEGVVAVRCWGDNQFGQSDPTTNLFNTPVGVSDPLAEQEGYVIPDRANALTAGVHHTCVIDGSDGARCWGADGDTAIVGSSGQEKITAGVDFCEIAASTAGTVIVDEEGSLRFWGLVADPVGEATGCATTCAPAESIGNPEGANVDFGGISIGLEHGCAIKSTPPASVATAQCWGSNSDHQIGVGEASSLPVDTAVAATQVSAGWRHSCAVDGDTSSLKCWGDNSSGQIGVPPDVPTWEPPTPVQGDYVYVSAGDEFTCAVTTANELECWGSTADGRLGIGDVNGESSLSEPQPVEVRQ
jgi:alpha-tubulin suppressor-like RCC1 family protein